MLRYGVISMALFTVSLSVGIDHRDLRSIRMIVGSVGEISERSTGLQYYGSPLIVCLFYIRLGICILDSVLGGGYSCRVGL